MTATQTPGRGRPPGDMNPAGRSQQPRPGTTPRRRQPDPLAAALRRRRENAGLTQAELAAAIGMGRETVGRWEAGRRRLHTDEALKIAAVLGYRLVLIPDAPATAATDRAVAA